MSGPADAGAELRRAIAAYHDLLTDDLAGATQGQLDDQLTRRGLFFGDRRLTTVLRPRFLTPQQYEFLQTRVRVLMSAFDKIYRKALADSAFRSELRLEDWEERLLSFDPGFRDSSPTARLDAFYVTDEGQVAFTEYNAETPASPAYNDVLTEVFYALPVMGEFLRAYQVRSLPARHGVLHALLGAYEQWRGRTEAPRIAILDWREVPTYSEFVLFEQYFREHGFQCVIADPRTVEYRDGRLVSGDFVITLIYKRVLLSELVGRGGLDHPVIRAVRDGAACMVNPFRCKVLHKKASLAVLSDERHAGLFNAEERAVIEAHIPWTRMIEERRTDFHGRTIDLVPFVIEHRQRFVLKPNDEYGGKGVLLGWLVDQSTWERVVTTALREPYLVQERVAQPTEPYPSLVDGRMHLSDRLLDTDPYVFHGAYMEGCLTRLSTEALLNVTAGGGSTVPTFVVERRAG